MTLPLGGERGTTYSRRLAAGHCVLLAGGPWLSWGLSALERLWGQSTGKEQCWVWGKGGPPFTLSLHVARQQLKRPREQPEGH